MPVMYGHRPGLGKRKRGHEHEHGPQHRHHTPPPTPTSTPKPSRTASLSQTCPATAPAPSKPNQANPHRAPNSTRNTPKKKNKKKRSAHTAPEITLHYDHKGVPHSITLGTAHSAQSDHPRAMLCCAVLCIYSSMYSVVSIGEHTHRIGSNGSPVQHLLPPALTVTVITYDKDTRSVLCTYVWTCVDYPGASEKDDRHAPPEYITCARWYYFMYIHSRACAGMYGRMPTPPHHTEPWQHTRDYTAY
ncbi:hypothetical protein K439DRAFT_1665435 [Ramaria rubella]|nr:hypothetical protein K439DRAFT_1665435 [Ramaria rubella]